MTVSVFDSVLLGELFGDPEVAAHLDDDSALRAMLAVVGALAAAQERLGVVPAPNGRRIAEAAGRLTLAPADLARDSARDGVPVPALVAALRAALDDESARYVHFGATSQDIVDTALVLRLRTILSILDGRLERLVGLLAALADRHRHTIMAGRTRWQQAVPIPFGLKAAGWLAPLIRHRRRLAELRPRLLVIQLGGAAGSLSALGARAMETADALAAGLGLGAPAGPWHNQRDGLAELAGWLSLVTGSVGRIGQDILLMAQSEVGEAAAGTGSSSTMPHKSNPVGAELLAAAARWNAGQVSLVHQAQLTAHERDGSAWQVEWLTLPGMLTCTGVALRQASAVLERLEIRATAMADNLERSHGLVLAEVAAFALAAHLPRGEAQRIVADACVEAAARGRHLLDVLAERAPAAVDWHRLRDPAAGEGASQAIIDRVLRDSEPG